VAEEVFARRETSPRALERDEAAETLFVAAWFRSRPKELKRTRSLREWLSSPRGR
jgi:hypothetical protein